ncbi:hypothetical protein TNCV_2892251 [Trichonephila clavipes]|nr:hypothetical protein TNCV_2892251 [Trichonephila clavipes]
MQVTVRFVARFHSNFKGELPGVGQVPPNSLSLPPTSREDLRLDSYLEYPHTAKALYTHLQTCMPSPRFEPRSKA